MGLHVKVDVSITTSSTSYVRHAELLPLDVQDTHVLASGLAGYQRCGDRRARLGDPKGTDDRLGKFNLTFVLVSLPERETLRIFTYPNHSIHPVGNHLFLNTIFGTPSEVAILVQEKQIESIFRILVLEEPNLVLPPHAVEALVPVAPESVEREARRALAENDRRDLDTINGGAVSKVIDEVGHGKQIWECERWFVGTYPVQREACHRPDPDWDRRDFRESKRWVAGPSSLDRDSWQFRPNESWGYSAFPPARLLDP